MPSYDGISTIFGLSVTVATADNPKAAQQNAFFGLDGVQSLFGGARGRYTTVSGLLYGATAGDLADAEALLRSYDDGIARVFVDSYGNAWPDVLLDSFQPEGRILQDQRGFFRQYKCGLKHLS